MEENAVSVKGLTECVESRSSSFDATMSSSEADNEHRRPIQQRKNRLLRAIPRKIYHWPGESTNSETTKTTTIEEPKHSEGVRGALAPLLDAPSDIFYEVAARLTPRELLSLCRASHHLRDLFLSKRSKEVWVISFASTDFPPCPQDLTEPQYASLLYDTDCIACGEAETKTLYIKLRLRMCESCFYVNVVESKVIFKEFFSLYSVTSEERNELKETVPEFTVFVKSDEYGEELYYRPDLLDGLVDCLIACRTKSQEDYRVFIDQRLKRKDAIIEHSRLLQAWTRKISNRHAESIKSRLRAIGYVDEEWSFSSTNDWVLSGDSDEWRNLVYRTKELTDTSWESLLPKLTEFLSRRREKIRLYRCKEELKTEYLAYYRNIPLTFGEVDFFPEVNIILSDQIIKNFLSYYDSAQPTVSRWEIFFPAMEHMRRDYKLRALSKHSKAVMNERSKKQREISGLADLQYLSLASSFFNGSVDHKKFYFFNSIHSIGYPPTPDHLLEREKPMSPWTDSFFSRDSDIRTIDSEIPDELLNDLRLPLTTKMTTMQSMGARFACERCHESFQKMMVWSELVKHYVDEIADDRQAQYYVKMRDGDEPQASSDEETGDSDDSDEDETSRNDELESRNNSHRRTLKIKIIVDHSLEGGSLARILSDAELASALESQAVTESLPKIFTCKLCDQLGIHRHEYWMTEPQIQAHIRIKHDKEPQPEDRGVDLLLFNLGIN